jgi:hypothetical protein
MPKINAASQSKETLRDWHYTVESAIAREIVAQQYDYQLYPGRLKKLLAKTGANKLKIIPIGDFDKEGDFWVIPFERVRDLLIHENLAKSRRWRFHMEDHLFVLFPGDRVRLGEINMREFYGSTLPIINSN